MIFFKQDHFAFRFHKVKVWRLSIEIPLPECERVKIKIDNRKVDEYSKEENRQK